MTLNELSVHCAAEFERLYGRQPRWIVAAPGRVNIIGEHTDYNDGFVLPMAIERYAIMAADVATAPGTISIYDGRFDENIVIDVSSPVMKGSPKWSNYIRGVLYGFQKRGVRIPSLDVSLLSTVPLGGGLSSSAALEVCTATLMEAVSGKAIDPIEKALLAQTAEHDFADVPCGIMDQFISVLGREGHLLLLDCRTRETEMVLMDDPSVALLVINTNVKHELSGGEYTERRSQCEEAAKNLGVKSLRDVTLAQLANSRDDLSGIVFRRARHVVGEINRTIEAAHRTRAGHWTRLGELMYASHASLRDYYEVSCKELDAVVGIASDIGCEGGVYGCRMTGGGFGGCCVALVKGEMVENISSRMATDYKVRTGIEAAIFSSRPAAGAAILMS